MTIEIVQQNIRIPIKQRFRGVAAQYVPESLKPIIKTVLGIEKVASVEIPYPHNVTLELAGQSLQFEVANQLEEKIVNYNQTENEFMKWMCKVAQGKNVWDIGSAEGAHTMLLAMSGAKQVFSFEPDPEHRKALRINLNLNMPKNDNICVFPYALWNENTELTLNTSGREGRAPQIDDPTIAPMYAFNLQIKVPAFRIEDFAADCGHPNLIKIDAEGGEYQILQGMGKVRPEHIFLEAHILRTDPYDLGKLLSSMGYVLQRGYLRGDELLSHFTIS